MRDTNGRPLGGVQPENKKKAVILRAEHVSFSYCAGKMSSKSGLPEAVRDVNADFHSGQLIVIIGPNGSGKTTLLKCLASIYRNYSGRIYATLQAGRDGAPQAMTDMRLLKGRVRGRLVSYVPQNTNVDFDFTVHEIVLMGRNPHLGYFSSEGEADLAVARTCMEEMGVWELRDKIVRAISGGERQRVMIARALTQQAPLMLLDEPASMLDIYHQVAIMELLRRHVRTENGTVITVMHDLNMAAKYADEMILMDRGAIAARGRPEQVLTAQMIKQIYHVEGTVTDAFGSPVFFVK